MFDAAHYPERHAFALQLLMAMIFFGIGIGIMDYLGGRYLTSAEDMSISAIAFFILRHARTNHQSKLPLAACITLITCMYYLGDFTLLPTRPEKAVWAILYPFVFFFLTGLRSGLQLSLLALLAMPLSYYTSPFFNPAPRVSLNHLLQAIGAFSFSIILAYKYEQVRTMQEAQLRHSAECDPLTGLLNRRGFADLSHSVVRHAISSQQSFSVLLIDIDDFKQVNDTQGHHQGDQLLREIATLLQHHSRSTDLIARWGGEEFILLLAHTDLDSARAVAEKIRSAICEYSFATGKHTASLGIAVHGQNESLETTINRADRAMYQAKSNGKNKVEILEFQPA